LVGARDNDIVDIEGFQTYDRFQRDYSNPTGIGEYPKMAAFVHGANHNYFNTIWTDSAALNDADSNEDLGMGFDDVGRPKKVNNWACSVDDADSDPARCQGDIVLEPLEAGSWKMPAKQQRTLALRTISAFFRWHLKGELQHREIFTGSYKPSDVYWTYQDAVRLVVDNFEQVPITTNTLSGNNGLTLTQGSGSIDKFEEYLLNREFSTHTNQTPRDSRFPHDTRAAVLEWTLSTVNTTASYTALIPHQPVSSFTHLTFRIAHPPMFVGNIPLQGLEVSLTSENEGVTKTSVVKTNDFGRIPYPYERSGGMCDNLPISCDNQPVLNSVRIPLEVFDVDLSHVIEIKITAPSSGEIAIDDIEFVGVSPTQLD
jgi:hypothetical protein